MAIFENVDGQAVAVGTASRDNASHSVADSISKSTTASHRDANHVLHELRQTRTEDVNGVASRSQTDTSVEKGVKYVSAISEDAHGHVTVAGTRSIESTDKHGEIHRESVTVSRAMPHGVPLEAVEAGVKSMAKFQMESLHAGVPLAREADITTEVAHATIQTAKDGSSLVHRETLGVDSHGTHAGVDEISTKSVGEGISAIQTRQQDSAGNQVLSERLEVHSRSSKGEDVVAQHTEILSAHPAAARIWSYGGAEKELSSGGMAIDSGRERGLSEHVGAAGGAGPAYPPGAAGPGHLSGGAGGVGLGEHVGGAAGGSGPGTASLSSHTHDSIVSYLTDKAGYAAHEAKQLVNGVSDYLGNAIPSHVSGSGGALEFNKTGAEAVSMNHSASGSIVASHDGTTASIPMDRLKAVHESGMVQDLASRDMGSQSHVQELSR